METTCPVFEPTMEEFSNFEAYVAHIEQNVGNSGIAKVIPPKGWFTCDYTMPPDWKVVTPIRQEVVTRQAGVYQVILREKSNMKYKDFVDYDAKNSYASENFEDREREFWQYMGNKGKYADPIYGADMSGSLFGDFDSAWNLKNLQTPLKLIEGDLPGVTSPMLYVGTWRAMFCYHTEDMDLYSINYLHTGAPKSWYSIPTSDRARFESFMQGQFTAEYNECHEYLRHKNSIISKNKLKSAGLSYDTVVQMPGEFVITFPGAYHAGYNHGLNIAEATNFCTEKWIGSGRLASICLCRPHSVSIDMDYFETTMWRKRVSDSRDVSVIRCCCGLRVDAATRRDDLQTCRFCGAQYHKDCVASSGLNASAAECHICANIRLRDEEENAILTEEELDDYEKSLDAKELYFTENPLKKGTLVSARIFPPMGTAKPPYWVNGTVADICEGYFRFHMKTVKGQKRDKDTWIDMNNYARFGPVQNEFESEQGAPLKKRQHSSDDQTRTKRMKGQSCTPVLIDPRLLRQQVSSQSVRSPSSSLLDDEILDRGAKLPIPAFLQSYLCDESIAKNEFLPRGALLPLPTREQIVMNVIEGLCKNR